MTKQTICKRCIMDATDPDIVFDADGICNHCHRYDSIASSRLIPESDRPARLAALVAEIKRQGAGKPYDCVIGVSGGVDSTYVAYLTKELGLRPLAVHFDNGWNSELAVANVEKTLKTLGIDLSTYVVDWQEFRDIQLAFLEASTPDGEVPTDHAIAALLYSTAHKLGLKHILLGLNVISESIMPLKWGYGYADFRYIRGVHRMFGKRPMKTYPHYSLPQLYYYMYLRKIRMVPILDFVDYQKEQAMQIIQDKLGWVYYGGKHYESIYTRFYQAYILPRKFNIDKRRAHYSNLVLSGQMTRDEALTKITEPVFPERGLAEDKEYVIKKFGLSVAEFERLMALPTKTFLDYPNSYTRIETAKKYLLRK
ncbi:MAG TPA: N-acetyl sugar amidotransferase [Noviherbaspirillum sp.]|jgi:N-acetyl sugar amidotransferase|uniref:N-acetyl sugar amidotransferase n=1 Tax=Noviherbaspirillum sp. TaxID=1926288 RepID=UPI002F92D483